MNITPSLNHINLKTHDMNRIIRFYGDVLGFKPGYRPPFSNTGCWMYLDNNPLIHLVQIDTPPKNDDPAVNHFALTGSGLGAFLKHLQGLDVSYNVTIAPEIDLRQVVVHDPDGNMFEVLFKGVEAEGVDVSSFKSTSHL